jgi:aminoglycoside phosphotransferase (APT) family kinase protein
MRADDRAWVAAVLGGRLVATRRLKGGISAQTRAVLVERPDGTRVRAVHRRIGDGWREAEPGIVDREAALLEELEERGVPAPRLLAHQSDGGLLMTFEPGRPEHRPTDRRRAFADLAAVLVRIHEGGPPKVEGLRPQFSMLDDDVREATPRRHGNPVDASVWAHVARLWPVVARPSPTLIHDDFHPGNVLQSRHRVTAVVDWTGAGVGAAASDACYLRLDVALVLGLEAGDEMLAAYEAELGASVADRPFWDLVAAARAAGVVHLWHGSWVDFGLDDLPLPVAEERLAAFVARAVADAG